MPNYALILKKVRVVHSATSISTLFVRGVHALVHDLP